ncbi:hypothetical protein OUZ56_032469 [Daphnia magna]|uniref:Uncharacterized protein n=1 Tax=Daphnia magna TaxID=35525 RepID=A0ABR0B8Z8_9CRUS|nr:hypothetical protein OUZ56_032469 [Daphnia magna]
MASGSLKKPLNRVERALYRVFLEPLPPGLGARAHGSGVIRVGDKVAPDVVRGLHVPDRIQLRERLPQGEDLIDGPAGEPAFAEFTATDVGNGEPKHQFLACRFRQPDDVFVEAELGNQFL